MDGIGAGRVTLSGSPRHICGVGDTRAQEGVELSGSGGGPHVRHSFAELQTGRVNRTNEHCVGRVFLDPDAVACFGAFTQDWVYTYTD